MLINPRTMFGIWVAWAILCVGAAGGAVYTAVHFIRKFW